MRNGSGQERGKVSAYGKILYTDIFDSQHWTTFCYDFDPATGEFTAYHQYNEADNDSAPQATGVRPDQIRVVLPPRWRANRESPTAFGRSLILSSSEIIASLKISFAFLGSAMLRIRRASRVCRPSVVCFPLSATRRHCQSRAQIVVTSAWLAYPNNATIRNLTGG